MAKLQGAKEIAEYLKMSIPTLMDRVHFYDCPVKKLGGILIADTEHLDVWWKDLCAPGNKTAPKPENMLEKRNGKKRVAARRF